MKKAAPWLLLGGVLLVAAIVLRIQGRLWICSCGYVAFWRGDINSAENSQQLFDPYTFTHVIHGFLFAARADYNPVPAEATWAKLFDLWDRNLKQA